MINNMPTLAGLVVAGLTASVPALAQSSDTMRCSIPDDELDASLSAPTALGEFSLTAELEYGFETVPAAESPGVEFVYSQGVVTMRTTDRIQRISLESAMTDFVGGGSVPLVVPFSAFDWIEGEVAELNVFATVTDGAGRQYADSSTVFAQLLPSGRVLIVPPSEKSNLITASANQALATTMARAEASGNAWGFATAGEAVPLGTAQRDTAGDEGPADPDAPDTPVPAPSLGSEGALQ